MVGNNMQQHATSRTCKLNGGPMTPVPTLSKETIGYKCISRVTNFNRFVCQFPQVSSNVHGCSMVLFKYGLRIFIYIFILPFLPDFWFILLFLHISLVFCGGLFSASSLKRWCSLNMPRFRSAGSPCR